MNEMYVPIKVVDIDESDELLVNEKQPGKRTDTLGENCPRLDIYRDIAKEAGQSRRYGCIEGINMELCQSGCFHKEQKVRFWINSEGEWCCSECNKEIR
jgi:hypothetical protein